MRESIARAGKRAKRETAMVSYDCEAWHSGDGVILLVEDGLILGVKTYHLHE